MPPDTLHIIPMQVTSVVITQLPDGRLSHTDAATYLGIAPKTLANMRSLCTGPDYVKFGTHVFYFRHDLDHWITAHKVQPNAA